MANNINVNVGAQGLAQSINQQVNQAQAGLNRRPLQLKLDAKGFRQPLGRITGDINEFQKSLDASVARTFAFGAAVGVVNQVNQAFKALVTTTIEVQKELANINVLLGATTSDLAKFSTQLFGVAKNTAQTFQTVAEAATEFSRQGLSAEQTLKRVNDAMILTRLSGLSATQSVEALTAAVNGFRKEAITSTEVINRLANVDAAFAVSSKDLADALARAGSTAQGAKVEFNELLAAVTSVQQQTARGGAVIGNAFKSIFTRIQRSGVQDALNEIGVATKNADGSFRSGIQVIKDYAATYNTLTDAQKAYTSEQIAGVFQINNLKALVNDLNSEYSIYNRALATANNSTDQAARRNDELNKTMSAMLAQTAASAAQLAAAIGELAAQPAIERLLKIIGSVADFFTKALDPEKGSKLAKGFFSGIGAFISGPGLIIIGGAFLKLFAFIGKQASGALKEVFKMNTETARQQQLQQGILALVTSEEAVYRQLVANAGNQAAQEQIILTALKKQTAERATQQAFLAQMAASPAFKGLEVSEGVIQRRRGRRGRGAPIAGGHIPVFANTDEVMVRDFAASAEADAVRRGVGGARPTARVVKTSINPQRDAIFNRDMVASMGMPAGAQRIAAQGFIPNFVSAGFDKAIGFDISKEGKARGKALKDRGFAVARNRRNKEGGFTGAEEVVIDLSKGAVITPNINEFRSASPGVRKFTDKRKSSGEFMGATYRFVGSMPVVGPLVNGSGENLLTSVMDSNKGLLGNYLKGLTQDFFKKASPGKTPPFVFSDNMPDVNGVNTKFQKKGIKGDIFEEIVETLQGDIKAESARTAARNANAPFDLNPASNIGGALKKLFELGPGINKGELKAGGFKPKEVAETKFVDDVMAGARRAGVGSVDPKASEMLSLINRKRLERNKAKIMAPTRGPKQGVPGVSSNQVKFVRDAEGSIFSVSQEGDGRPQYKQLTDENAKGKNRPFTRVPKSNITGTTLSFGSLSKGQQAAAKRQFSFAFGAASGFIPNFAAIDPLARAVNTERKFGGSPVVDFDPRVGTFVRDKNKQSNLSQAVAQHGGLAQALSDSKQMQGLADGFVPNFRIGGLFRGKKKDGNTGGDQGLGNIGLSFLVTQILQGALSQVPEDKLSGPFGKVLGGAAAGVSVGAIAGPWGMLIGGVLGAAFEGIKYAMDPVKISSEELAKSLEKLNASQKQVNESLDSFADAQAKLRESTKAANISGVEKAIEQSVDALVQLPPEVAKATLGTIGKGPEALAKVRDKFGGPTRKQSFEGARLDFVKASETKDAEKTENLTRGVKGLIGVLESAGSVDTAQIERFATQGILGKGWENSFENFLYDLEKTGQLTKDELRDLSESIDPKDFRESMDLIKKEAERINLKRTLTKILTPLKKAEFDIDREFANLAKTIETRTALLASKFEGLSGALKTLSEGATDLFVGAGFMTQRAGIIDKATTSEQQIRADAEQQRIALETRNAAARSAKEQQDIAKELAELNMKETQQLDELRANTQAQLELLTLSEAIKTNTALTEGLLKAKDFKSLADTTRITEDPANKKEAERLLNIRKSLDELKKLIPGLDFTGASKEINEGLRAFNVSEILRGIGLDVDPSQGMEGIIKSLETELAGPMQEGQRRLAQDILEGLKLQQQVIEDPEGARDAAMNRIGDLFGVDLRGSSDKFGAAVEGLNKGERAIIASITALNKSFKPIETAATSLAQTTADLEQTTANITTANEQLAEAQRQYAENLEEVEKALTKLANKELDANTMQVSANTVNVNSEGNNAATGFIPSFSPLSRAITTEKNMGGRPVVDYHPSVGNYVRDERTQKNFADVIASHPEGIPQAINNSKILQNAAAGFVPNFNAGAPNAPFRPIPQHIRSELELFGVPGIPAVFQEEKGGGFNKVQLEEAAKFYLRVLDPNSNDLKGVPWMYEYRLRDMLTNALSEVEVRLSKLGGAGTLPPPPVAPGRPPLPAAKKNPIKTAMSAGLLEHFRDPMYFWLHRNEAPNKLSNGGSNLTVQDAFWVNFINSPFDEFKKKYAGNIDGARSGINQGRLANAGRANFADFFGIDQFDLAKLLLDQNEQRSGPKNSLRSQGVGLQELIKAVKGSKTKAFKGKSVNDILAFMEASDRHLAKLSKIYVSSKGDVEAVERAINPNLVSLDLWNRLPNKALAGKFSEQRAKEGAKQRQQAAFDMLGNNEKIAKFLRLLPGINQAPGAELAQLLKVYDMEQEFDARRGDYNLVKSLQSKKFASIFEKSSPASRSAIFKRIDGLQPLRVPGVDVVQNLASRKDIAKALGVDEFMLDVLIREGVKDFNVDQRARKADFARQMQAASERGRAQRAEELGVAPAILKRVGNNPFAVDIDVAVPQGTGGLGATIDANNAAFMSALTPIGRLKELERDGSVKKGFFFKQGTQLQPRWARLSPERLAAVATQFEKRNQFARGFVPNFSALGEIAASIGAGYKNPVSASQVRSTNIPGLGKVNYNTQESVFRAPGMQQPFIVPPRNSKVAPDYARKVEGKFGFNPYKSGLAAGGFVPNFQGPPKMDFTKFSESVTQFGEDVDRFAEAMTKTLEGQLNVNVDTSTTVDSAAIRDAVQNGVINAVTNYFTSGPGVQNIVDLSQQVFNQNLG